MMWQTFLMALCLVMVIEGILPFLAPRAWREAMQTASALSDKKLRIIGLISMLSGVLMLYMVH